MICLKYTDLGIKEDLLKQASQIQIPFNRINDDTLEEFIKVNKDKHIYIRVDDSEIDLFNQLNNLKKLQSLKIYTNWTLQFPVKIILKQENKTLNQVKFDGIKDCCNTYMFTDLVGQWEILQFIISLMPSEVYITNILGFSIKNVYNICNPKGIGIRVYANWAQSSWDDTPDINKFFVRPEDVDDYKPFLSGIDLQGDSKIQNVMFDVYQNKKFWFGNLKEIIIGFNENVDSRRLPKEFGAYRLNCGKRCICGKRCHLCRVMQDFAERLEKTDTIVKHD